MSERFLFDSGKFIFYSLQDVVPTNCDPTKLISSALAVQDVKRMEI